MHRYAPGFNAYIDNDNFLSSQILKVAINLLCFKKIVPLESIFAPFTFLSIFISTFISIFGFYVCIFYLAPLFLFACLSLFLFLYNSSVYLVLHFLLLSLYLSFRSMSLIVACLILVSFSSVCLFI